jgi:hypothetical protein
MSDYPYLAFLPIVAIALVFVLWSRRRVASAIASNGDKNLSAVALRLGLTVVEGDANTNLLYFMQPSADFSRRIRATGQPYGRPVELTIVDGRKTDEYIVARRITTTFGCFLEATTRVRLPPFEVVLRQPNQYLVPHQAFAGRPGMFEVPIGQPQLDAMFVVRSTDPRIGPALAGALSTLATHLFVHLAGEDTRLWSSFTRMGLPYFAQAAEEYLLALESAACGVEGRPAPARLGVPALTFGLPQPPRA